MGQLGISLFLSYRKKKLEASEREKRLFLEESVAARFFSFSCFRPPEKRNRNSKSRDYTHYEDLDEKECDFIIP